MIMNTSTAYYSGAESISNKKFANNQARRHTLYIKDPASAITHFIGAIFSLGASSPLLIKAAQTHQPVNIIAMIIYSISLSKRLKPSRGGILQVQLTTLFQQDTHMKKRSKSLTI